MDCFPYILGSILVMMSAYILDNIPLTEGEVVLLYELDRLDGEGLVMSSAFLFL